MSPSFPIGALLSNKQQEKSLTTSAKQNVICPKFVKTLSPV